jgi:hypothetical protein
MWTQNMSRNAEVKKKWSNRQTMNCSRTHVLTALTTTGICNVRALSLSLSFEINF